VSGIPDLRRAADAATRAALETGALAPIETELEYVHDGGMDFLVRIAAGLASKPRIGTSAPRPGTNPFLPYDPQLYVANLGPGHVVLLNKFPVVAGHLLIVTREYRSQEELLDPEDFRAWARALRENDGLAFYNGGRTAGASQPHKHLQLVPLPLAPKGPAIPAEAIIAPSIATAGIARAPQWPFIHAAAAPDCDWTGPAETIAAACHALYLELLTACSLGPRAGSRLQPGPYNLLLTRRFMLCIARRRERVAGISINALGYAGSLLAANRPEAERIRRLGPQRLLAAAALS
jgi:ATP adenylyltransferase